MINLFKRTKKIEVVPNLALNPFTEAMSQSPDKIIFGNFEMNSNTDDIDKLMKLKDIAKVKGLYGQVDNLKKRIVATALATKNLSLIQSVCVSSDLFQLFRFETNGKVTTIRNPRDPSGSHRWQPQPLKYYRGDMPNEIIEKMPNGNLEDFKVYTPFLAVNDPVVTIRVRNKNCGVEKRGGCKDCFEYEIGLFIWK